jgi:hypothetical protein
LITMAERLTMKSLSEDLDSLSKQVQELELQLEGKIESTLERAAEKLRARIEASQAAREQTTPVHGTGVHADERQRMIAEEAYLRAERRGFTGGDPSHDWVEAEIEIDRRLLEGKPKKPAPRRKKNSTKKTRSEASARAQ